MIDPETLREIAKDAETATSCAMWDYPQALNEAANEIERLREALHKIDVPYSSNDCPQMIAHDALNYVETGEKND